MEDLPREVIVILMIVISDVGDGGGDNNGDDLDSCSMIPIVCI